MIPKIIHYCWFGHSEKPANFKEYLESWKKHLPEYTLKEWNEENFDVNICNYSREAYYTRNMAFVSDVCRVYALLTEGGIYLDTDVKILKSLDEKLNLKNGFLGMETETLIGTGLMAAPKGAMWVSALFNYYKRQRFINIWGHPMRTPNTKILTYKIMPKIPTYKRPKVFPMGFIGGDFINHTFEITPNTFAVHYYQGSWKYKKTLKVKLKNLAQGFCARHFKTDFSK